MICWRHAASFGLGATFVAFVQTSPARANETVHSYAAYTEVQTANGTARTTETLSVFQRDTTSFVSVSSANGALLSLPTTFSSDGEIVSNAFDPSVICYNMAVAALYSHKREPAQKIAVNIHFGDSTVPVPLTLKETPAAGDGTLLLGSGTKALTIASDTAELPAGMFVDARIHIRGGELSDVIFNEATLVGTPPKTLSRLTCTLSRTSSPAQDNAPAPAAVQS